MLSKLHITILSAALALSAACGGDKGGGDDQAFLTIVGDKNVFLDNGDVQKLRIRYHDGDDNPLAGAVDFRMVGTNGGAVLSKNSGITNASGVVEIEVTAGSSGAASFQIEAEADYASAARWTISVGNGVPDLDPTGRYELKSKLDIVSGLDNDVGEVLNTFIDMTDGPHDPASFLIDLGLEKLEDSGGFGKTIAGALQLLRGTIDPAVNEFIMDNAPEFVQDLTEIGEALGDVTRNFGMVSTLDVDPKSGGDPDNEGHEATHLVTGVYFDILGDEYSWTMAELDVDPIDAEEISVSKDSKNMLVINKHQLPLSYGSAIVVALQRGILPLFDDQADSSPTLAEFLQHKIDCEGVGDKLLEEVGNLGGIASSSTYEGLCEFGLEAGAAVVIDKILDIDEAGVTLDVQGLARPRDTNGDRKIDALQAGKWSGDVVYIDTPASLDPENNTFTGTRISNSQ
jgi:hypothetical protein